MWWSARWVLIPGAVILLFVLLIMSRIETGKCLKSCNAAGYESSIYAAHRWRPATCECVNPRARSAHQ